MKKWILAFLFLTGLGVAAVAACRYLLPERHVSDLYRRYHNADGIAASYIHNFPVNDTLTLDVTLLEATTDSAWQVLCAYFAVSKIIDEATKEGITDVIFSRQVNRHDYSQVVLGDSPDAEILAIAYNSKSFSIFHTNNDAEILAVFHHNYHNIDK